MVLNRVLKALLCLGFVSVLWTAGFGQAVAQSATDRRLVETAQLTPGFEVTALAFSSDETSLYVAGNGDQGGIVRFDLEGEERISQSFEGAVSQILVGLDRVFVIGTLPNEAWVEMRDPVSLELLARRSLPPIGEPKGHLSKDGMLYVGGYTPNGRNNSTIFALDPEQADLGASNDAQQELQFRGVIGHFWVSDDERRIFVNDAETARLWSLTFEGQVETSVGHQTQSRLDVVPFSIAASAMNVPECREILSHLPDQPTRFVIADHLLGSVNSAVFSDAFGVFDIISETNLRLDNLRGVELEAYEYSNVIRPPMLISASCDQSTILIASRYSDQVVQFAHQIGSNAFELVMKWQPRPGQSARAVATSDQGHWGAVALADGSIAVMTNNSGVAKEQASVDERINRAIQRELLFIGYKIGAIDGILGGKTSAAMEAFAKKHNLDVGVSEPLLFLQELQKIAPAKID